MRLIWQRDVGGVQKKLCGMNVNAADESGWTPLMEAARCGNVDIIKVLLNEGADVNQKNKNEETAAVVASHGGHVGAYRMIKVKEWSMKDDEAQDEDNKIGTEVEEITCSHSKFCECPKCDG